MTYVTDQTSAELCAHMRKLKAMPGWHEPLADRLWKEVQDLTLERDAIRAALQDKAEVRDARFWLEAIVDIWNDGDKAPEHRCYVEGAFSDAMREASALIAAQPAPVVVASSNVCKHCECIFYGGGPVMHKQSGAVFDRAIAAVDPTSLMPLTPAPVVPDFNSIAARKLSGLQDAGWQINGYAIRRGDERGFVDASGFVGWWRGEHDARVPDDVARLDWIRDNLFTHRWNGVVGFGCAVQWQIGPDFRHKQADLRDVSGPDGDFRAAIDAAMITASRTTSQQKGGQHG